MIIYLCIGLLIVIIVLIIISSKKSSINCTSTISPYIEALHLLLSDKKEQAVVNLKKTVQEDSENIMAYILLGNIYRELDKPEQAAKIHSNLLVRENLSISQKNNIIHTLIEDYIAAGQYKKAIESTKKLSKKSKKNIGNNYLLLKLYEKTDNWDNAFICRQHLNKLEKKKRADILALYKVEAGLQQIEKKEEHKARLYFREAIKIDKKCIPAFLYIGDSYCRDDKKDDAVKIWTEFTENNPNHAYLAFKRLKGILFEIGKYSKMEKIYQNNIQKKINNFKTQMALAEFYKKQGQYKRAADLCNEVLLAAPDSLSANFMLISILKEQNKSKEALIKAINLINKELKVEETYICSACGYESEEPLWNCPECDNWNTFL